MRMMRIMRIIVLCACFLCVFFMSCAYKKTKVDAHIFLCFSSCACLCVFLVCAYHICVMRIPKKHKKTQKNMRILEKHTKKYAHQNAHNAHDAQNFVCFSKCAYFFAVFFNAQNFVFFS